jgi:hypothetical protein
MPDVSPRSALEHRPDNIYHASNLERTRQVATFCVLTLEQTPTLECWCCGAGVSKAEIFECDGDLLCEECCWIVANRC